MKILRAVLTPPGVLDAIEREIKLAFKTHLYEPLIAELAIPRGTIKNAPDDLIRAISTGRITHSHGRFRGKFDSDITKELKELGAVWDNTTGSFRITLALLPASIQMAIRVSEARFIQKISAIDKRLAQVLPEKIAGSVKISSMFDSSLWKIDREIKNTVRDITVMPTLTAGQVKRISDEWQTNMDLWIKNFTEEQIVKLRQDIADNVYKGNRYESMIKTIRDSYGVTQNKAKFLARQETNLLLTKFKESRYTDSGITEYKWVCVAGSKNHPVRPSHKILDGKTFAFDDPPITTEPGQPVRRNNPGQDYNCRCVARPIVRFK